MSGELSRDLLARIREVNDWRTTQPELRLTVAAVLSTERVGSVAELARSNPEAFEAIHQIGCQLASPELEIANINGPPLGGQP